MTYNIIYGMRHDMCNRYSGVFSYQSVHLLFFSQKRERKNPINPRNELVVERPPPIHQNPQHGRVPYRSPTQQPTGRDKKEKKRHIPMDLILTRTVVRHRVCLLSYDIWSSRRWYSLSKHCTLSIQGTIASLVLLSEKQRCRNPPRKEVILLGHPQERDA